MIDALKLSLFILFFTVTAAAFATGGYAKTSPEDAFQTRDVGEMAYPKDRRGCEMRSAMFVATMKEYKAGKPVEEVAGMKILKPIVQEIYDTIREKGLVRATVRNMEQYHECLESVQKLEDEKARDKGAEERIEVKEKKLEMIKKHRGCSKINRAILETFEILELGRSIDPLMSKYHTNPIDVSWTAYKDIPSPAIYFIGKIYNAAQNGSMEEAVELGSNISVACYM